jgi:hypothetical protein
MGVVRRRVHQHGSPAVAQDVGQLGRGEPGVERYEDRAREPGAEQRLQERGLVRAEVGDPVAALHAEPGQYVRHACGAFVQLTVRLLAIAVDDRDPVGRHPRPPRGPRADALVTHRPGPAAGRRCP